MSFLELKNNNSLATRLVNWLHNKEEVGQSPKVTKRIYSSLISFIIPLMGLCSKRNSVASRQLVSPFVSMHMEYQSAAVASIATPVCLYNSCS